MRLWLVRLPIRWLYQLILSPALHLWAGPQMGCRFLPTCSDYALEAVEVFGWQKGLFLSLRRLCRCHPLSRAGLDPVPRSIERAVTHSPQIEVHGR